MPLIVLKCNITYCVRQIQFLASLGKSERSNDTSSLLALLSAMAVVQPGFLPPSEQLAPVELRAAGSQP